MENKEPTVGFCPEWIQSVHAVLFRKFFLHVIATPPIISPEGSQQGENHSSSMMMTLRKREKMAYHLYGHI